MPHELDRLLQRLEDGPAVLVTVSGTQGSVPRETGAWMAVFARDQIGTVGGGHLEWDVLRQAREWLAQPEPRTAPVWERSVALGPSLGQCCGGRLSLRFEAVAAADVDALRGRLRPRLTPLSLFGGGHVGRAIVEALAPLPFEVRWIDSRDGVFPSGLSPCVTTEHSDPVQHAVRDLPGGSLLLIMSFSHAEDLDVVAACLERCRERADLPFIGLIGSQTKWASFRSRLRARGFSDNELDRITCPIGVPGIAGKEPAVIAASVVAQLLLVRSAMSPA